MKQRILENYERMNNKKVKIWVNTIKFSSLEFPKLCLMAEARLSYCLILFSVYVEKIFNSYILNGGR